MPRRSLAATDHGAVLSVLLALVAWGASLALAVQRLPPSVPSLPAFSSDSAIPVLMARAPTVDLFHAYYLGQDRFGAWPFLLARALGGTDWTAEGLQAVLLAVSWTAAFALARLARLGPLSVGMLLLVPLALVLPLGMPRFVLELSQPYGWQAATLAWAWLGLRAVATAGTRRSTLGWGLVATVPSMLAVWVSTSSLPPLAALAALEALRAHVRREGRPGVGRLAFVLPLVLALVLERQLRRLYHRFADHHFGHAYRTAVELDRGHLLDNTRQVLARLTEGPVPLLVLLALLAAGLALTFWRARRVSRPLPDAFWVAAGFGLAGLAQLPVLVAITHVRLNEFNIRYFCLVQLFAVLGLGTLVLAAVTAWVPLKARRLGGAVVAVALAVPVLFVRPAPLPEDPAYTRAREAARALAAVAPGTLLLGDYWRVYLLAALQPPGPAAARPLPRDGDYQRTPFHQPALRAASEAVWVQADEDAAEGPPPLHRTEHRAALDRDPEPLLRVPGFTFWRYRSARPAPLAN